MSENNESKNDTSNGDEQINNSTTNDEDIYDPEPFLGCPCGKKFVSDIPYKKHMATFHPLTNSPKNDTSNTEEQIRTLNVDKDLDISDIYPNIIEDPNNTNGIEQVSDPMLWSPNKSLESDASTIVPPVGSEVEAIDSNHVSLLLINFLSLTKKLVKTHENLKFVKTRDNFKFKNEWEKNVGNFGLYHII